MPIMRVESHTNSTVFYEIDTDKETCSCPAWVKGKRRPCKHLQKVGVIPKVTYTAKELWAGEVVSRTESVQEAVHRTLGRTNETDPLMLCKTEDEVEGWAVTELREALASHEYREYAVRAKDDKAKWRLASGIQKAIRRNKPNSALVLAYALFKSDRPYLLYRLAVIAVEDIGIGNLPAVVQFFFIMKYATFRREQGDVGEWLMISYLVEQFAVGAKDRNSVEVAVLGGHRKVQNPRACLENWYKQPDREGLPVAMDATIQLYKSNKGKLADLATKAGVPYAVTYAMERSFMHMKDPLGAGMPVIYTLMQLSEYLTVEDDPDLMEDGQVGYFTACTFDKHTGEGKRAFGYWRKALEADDWLLSVREEGNDTTPNEMVGMLMFDWEGSRCRSRLNYEYSRWLQNQAQVKIDSYVGMAEHGEEFALKFMKPKYDQLLIARRVIMGKR